MEFIVESLFSGLEFSCLGCNSIMHVRTWSLPLEFTRKTWDKKTKHPKIWCLRGRLTDAPRVESRLQEVSRVPLLHLFRPGDYRVFQMQNQECSWRLRSIFKFFFFAVELHPLRFIASMDLSKIFLYAPDEAQRIYFHSMWKPLEKDGWFILVFSTSNTQGGFVIPLFQGLQTSHGLVFRISWPLFATHFNRQISNRFELFAMGESGIKP